MGYLHIGEMNRRIIEKYQRRFAAAGLPVPESGGFDGWLGDPRTDRSWDLLEELLRQEGKWDAEAIEKNRLGHLRIRVREREKELETIWRNATPGTNPFNGEPLEWGPEQEVLHTDQRGVHGWQALRDLGLQDEPRLRYLGDQFIQSLRAKTADPIGDAYFFQNLRPAPTRIDPAAQPSVVGSNGIDVEIEIPFAAVDPRIGSLQYLRYFPPVGLLHGRIESSSYYDRGGGGFGAGRGKRTTWYRPEFRLLMPFVNLRLCAQIQRKGMWAVGVDEDARIGRLKNQKKPRLLPSITGGRESLAEAIDELTGAIETPYSLGTGYVQVTRRSSGYLLRFRAARRKSSGE